VDATRVVNFWKITPKYALTLCNKKTLRFRVLTAQRGWARLILGRFQGLVLFPGNPTPATREPDF
jgi:hypothetical protein